MKSTTIFRLIRRFMHHFSLTALCALWNDLPIIPRSGPILPEFPNLPYREIICGAYRVIYRIDEESELIIVVTVAHAARLISRIIAP